MGPLKGIKIVELAGIGPAPFCAMLLADMGAEIIRIDRTAEADLGVATERRFSVLNRSRRSIAVDLKTPEGVAAVLRLIDQADALIEGFRPGVTERLGLGPDVCLEHNPRLVYGRMTGFGQDGTVAHAAGHDINYIALSGTLHAIGQNGGPPTPPLNLVGDFGGGGMFLAFGLVAALLEARASGEGQVIDCAMTEGAAYLATSAFGWHASGFWHGERGSNIVDTGSHFYNTYETSDGKWISVGSIERKFYRELLEKTGLDNEELPEQMDRSNWPEMKERLAAIFKMKSRDEWCEIMEGSDICFAPVLSFGEVNGHAHNKARDSFIEVEGVLQPAPTPRFSRTEATVQRPPSDPGGDTREALADWGFAADEIAALEGTGAVRQG